MTSQYDKLGSLLNEALENGEIPAGPEQRKVPFPDAENNKKEPVNRKLPYKIIASYKILNLDPGADKESVKAAYRRLIKKHHPDSNAKSENLQNEAGKKTERIIEAYRTLQNWLSEERNDYKP